MKRRALVVTTSPEQALVTVKVTTVPCVFTKWEHVAMPLGPYSTSCVSTRSKGAWWWWCQLDTDPMPRRHHETQSID